MQVQALALHLECKCTDSAGPSPALRVQVQGWITSVKCKCVTVRNADLVEHCTLPRVAASSQTLPMVDGGWGVLQDPNAIWIGHHLVFRAFPFGLAAGPAIGVVSYLGRGGVTSGGA